MAEVSSGSIYGYNAVKHAGQLSDRPIHVDCTESIVLITDMLLTEPEDMED